MSSLFFQLKSVFLLPLIIVGLGLSCKGPNYKKTIIYDLLPEHSFTQGMEGPAVDRYGNLYAVNFKEKGTIGIVRPDGVFDLYLNLPDGSVGNGIRFDKQGRMFIADYTGHNILIFDKNSERIEVFAHNEKMSQPNDIAISSITQFIYASDPCWADSTGNLWMIDTLGMTYLLEKNMGTTNGIEVSPDGKYLYVNESIQRKVWRYNINEDGYVSDKMEFFSFEDYGMDGMRCDDFGYLYITRHGKGSVVKLSPKGELIKEYQLKGKLPTNLTFSNDFSKIYVTIADRGCFEVIEL